jgi:hypothetical protein
MMKKAETASEINMSRSQPETAGFNLFGPAGEATVGPVASGEDAAGKTVELSSLRTEFILYGLDGSPSV